MVAIWVLSLSFTQWTLSALRALIAAALLETGYSTASDWFFQMVFVATAASIVSGTLAERIKLWPFLLFVVVPDRLHLPDCRFLAVGRWMVVRNGLL